MKSVSNILLKLKNDSHRKILLAVSIFIFFISSGSAFALEYDPSRFRCVKGGISCDYDIKYVDAIDLRRTLMTNMDPGSRGFIWDKPYLKDSDVIATEDGNLSFSSPSQACPWPSVENENNENIVGSCLEVMKYYISQIDQQTIEYGKRKFRVHFVFYKYNAVRSRNFNFGWGGYSGSDPDGVTAPDVTLGDFLSSPESLVLNMGNKMSDIFSLTLSLGRLGGFIESSHSISTRRMEHGDVTFGGAYGSTILYANQGDSYSSTPTSEHSGFSFSGKTEIVKTETGKSLFRFSDFDFYYGIPTSGGSNENSYSLVNVISPSTGGGYNFSVEPGKPYPLFELESSEFAKNGGIGLTGASKNREEKSQKIIGVLFVQEESPQDDFRRDGLDASQLDFFNHFINAEIRFDPQIVPVIRSTKGKSGTTAKPDYLVAAYHLKINEDGMPDAMKDEQLEVSVLSDDVTMEGGARIISAGRLATQGLQFGLAPKFKDRAINIRPLKFKVRVKLDRGSYLHKKFWTQSTGTNSEGKEIGPANYITYEMLHNLEGGADTLNQLGTPVPRYLPFPEGKK